MALQIGTIATVILTSLRGVDEGLAYALGVLSGISYFTLLGKKVDAISSKYSAITLKTLDSSSSSAAGYVSSSDASVTSSASQALPPRPSVDAEEENKGEEWQVDASNLQSRLTDKLTEQLSSLRYLTPILCLALLAFKEHVYNPEYQGSQYNLFHLVPQSIYISAMIGFLTLRLSLYVSEVIGEFRWEDLFSIIPGSLAIVIRKWLKTQSEEEAQEVYLSPRKVLFLTGPILAGRNEILGDVQQIVTKEKKGSLDSKKVTFIKPICVVDKERPLLANDCYDIVTKTMFEEMKRKDEIIFSTEERDGNGNIFQVIHLPICFRLFVN